MPDLNCQGASDIGTDLCYINVARERSVHFMDSLTYPRVSIPRAAQVIIAGMSIPQRSPGSKLLTHGLRADA